MVPSPCPSAGLCGCRVPLQLHGHRGQPGGGSSADGESWGTGGTGWEGDPDPQGQVQLGKEGAEPPGLFCRTHLGPVGPLDSISN